MKPRLVWVMKACLIIPLLAVTAFAAPRPPEQPLTGPGGADYRHREIRESVHGAGHTQFWLFEPAALAPDSAPVIVFLHGWGGMTPHPYQAWIEHLVRRGHIVIYPRYQANLRTPLREMTGHVIAAVKTALTELQTGRHVRPRLDRMAAVGHSLGGALAANLAALAGTEGLPEFKALMCVEPGDGSHRNPRVSLPRADWAKIPATTLLLTVAGADDDRAGDGYAREIYRGATQIPAANKDHIEVRSDDHGRPALKADHFAPTARAGAADALDYYGFWKLFDALTDAAFTGQHREQALGNTPAQRFMGRWSDGVPVTELVVTDPP